MRSLPLVSLVLVLVACGSPPVISIPAPPQVAAPAIAWLEDGAPTIAPPDVPWLETGSPIERDCPAGWTMGSDGCAPWRDAVGSCTGAQLRAPGEPACRSLSPSCPTGDFAEGLPAGTLYVLDGAAPGGDGSVASPFATLDEALAATSPGATVALSRGAHPIEGTVTLDVTLLGACASETSLEATTGARIDIVASVTIADLTMHPRVINDPLWAQGAIDVSIERVLLEGGNGYGITASDGSHVTLTDVRVANIGPLTSTDTPFSAGLAAERASILEGTRVVVDGATWIGASVENARIALTDSVLRGTHEAPRLSDAAGATCWRGGTLELTRTVLEANVSRGIEVLGDCTRAWLEDVAIVHTTRGVSGLAYGIVAGDDLGGEGVTLLDNAESELASANGAHTELSDVVVDGVSGEGTGIASFDEGTTLVLHRAVVRGTTVGLYVVNGGAVDAEDLGIVMVEGRAVEAIGTSIAVRRAYVADVATGFFAGGEGASIVASDIVVERVGASDLPDSDALTARAGARVEVDRAIVRDAMGTGVAAVQPDAVVIVRDLTCSGGGWGVAALDGTVEVTRGEIDAPNTAGAVVLTSASRVALTDVYVHDVPDQGPRTGPALTAADGGQLVLRGVLVERSTFGLVSDTTAADQPAPMLDLADVVFRDLRATALDLGAGDATLARIAIERVGDAGLVARTAAARVTLTDVAISELAGRADGRLGRGLHIVDGASLDAQRLMIHGARGVGVLASDAGTHVTITDAWIDGTLEEACGTSCADRAAGHGVVALFGAELALSDFRVSASAWAGVLVADQGVMTLVGGLIDGARVGRAVLGLPRPILMEAGVDYADNDALEARADVILPPSSLL